MLAWFRNAFPGWAFSVERGVWRAAGRVLVSASSADVLFDKLVRIDGRGREVAGGRARCVGGFGSAEGARRSW